MTSVFCHADARFAFFWETSGQPAARWHGAGEGPAQYVADTSDGAWAEFLRHEEITEADDLVGIARSLWVIEIPDDELAQAVVIDSPEASGGLDSHPTCQEIARQHRAAGASTLRAPSAALVPGGARGEHACGGLVEAGDRNGIVWVLFGRRPNARGWRVVEAGRPSERVLGLVRHLTVS